MEATQQSAELTIRRIYPVAAEKVWRAWTEPQALSQWFGAGNPGAATSSDMDLRVGGRYRIAFTGANDEAHEVAGVYQEVEPYTRLVFSWSWKSTPERVSRISITLTPVAAGTELTFVHDRFFDEQARINHERGWTAFFASLDRYLQEA